ncbi:type II toxin-antitoxin system PemK/MazF family toxin [Rhizobiaceae bacterium CRRU44]|uniref:Type II toxin-antitoxin system PemK/MazF family toxin n=1 Tax=Ferranicluibacter rubi TaxID=2715133 RepID=A0AA43ZIG5_9HYPH|nr:type II toxin-antitoxin system PemK/MazF family toxin [Ferranicluibacter rubi]NHT78269.1 type II toxin-antitoxin system PemK/MazF family toxin [Ferranicluibacter rubi]
MKLSRGDVVIAVFPAELGKPRPAVIMQADAFIEPLSSILACPITTYLIDAPVLRPIVAPTAENGLQHVSQVMVEKISPLKKEVIRQRIGQLGPADMTRLEIALTLAVGLPYPAPPTSEKKQQGEHP